jgi:cardiolipin synthase
MFFSRLKTRYTRTRYLHAKFMIFTMADGRKVALTGSHNFSGTGVLLGTREMALQTEDPRIIEQLEEFWKQHVA